MDICSEVPITILEEKKYTIEAVALNHGSIQSIAFAFQERDTIKVNKSKLKQYNLSGGAWIRTIKDALEKNISLPSLTVEGHSFSELQSLFFTQKGRRIVYASDFDISQSNQERLSILAKDADAFFCEAAYLNEDRELAIANHHQTVGNAASIAKKANVKSLHIFHHSRRYQHMKNALEEFISQGKKIFPNIQ